jgi:hypothetical protein
MIRRLRPKTHALYPFVFSESVSYKSRYQLRIPIREGAWREPRSGFTAMGGFGGMMKEYLPEGVVSSEQV